MGVVVGRRILGHQRQYRPNWTPAYACLDYTNEESRNSGRDKPFSASHPRFECSQFQPVTTECGACVNQQHPKARFHQQLSLDSERQAGDLGAVGADHEGHASTDAGGGDVQKWTPFPYRCRGRSASSLGSGRVRARAPYLRAGCGDVQTLSPTAAGARRSVSAARPARVASQSRELRSARAAHDGWTLAATSISASRKVLAVGDEDAREAPSWSLMGSSVTAEVKRVACGDGAVYRRLRGVGAHP